MFSVFLIVIILAQLLRAGVVTHVTKHFDAEDMYRGYQTWPTGPATLIIENCTLVSVVVQSMTPKCCDAAVIANSSCGNCLKNNMKKCFIKADTVDYSVKENSSCENQTFLFLQCLCLPGHCISTEAPRGNITTDHQPPLDNESTTVTSPPPWSLKTETVEKTSSTNVQDNITLPSVTTGINHDSFNPTLNETPTGNITTDHQPSLDNESTTVTSPPPWSLNTETVEKTSSTNVQDNISLPSVTTGMNHDSYNATLNETSTEQPFDIEQSKRDLYMFLAALGASLLLVLIIVCVFFFRKRRSKLPIVNISEEFWSSRDYINDPDDDGNFCGPGASYSVINPVYNTKTYRPPNIYFNTKENISPSYVKTDMFHPSYKSYTPQVDNTFRLEPMVRNSNEREQTISTDDEAGVVMDLTKIVSNEIKMQQRAGTIEDRKIITDKHAKDSSEPSTCCHYRKGKRHKESRQRIRAGQRRSGDASRRGPEAGLDQQAAEAEDMYALAYKNRLHDYLDQCSAEESDV